VPTKALVTTGVAPGGHNAPMTDELNPVPTNPTPDGDTVPGGSAGHSVARRAVSDPAHDDLDLLANADPAEAPEIADRLASDLADRLEASGHAQESGD